jgi:hypothetical protein
VRTSVCLKPPPGSGKNWDRQHAEGEGVKRQGLVDDHRYQAHLRSHGCGMPQDRSRSSHGQPKTARPHVAISKPGTAARPCRA